MTERDASDDNDQYIPQELIDEYLRIRRENITASKCFYFEKLMPFIRPVLEQRQRHVEIRGAQHQEGFTTLVSLMGFSPETTVHAAVILQPHKLVIAYSANARDSARPALDYLHRERIVDYFDLERVEIDAFDPQDIYDKLHGRLANMDRVIFDITGGTKVMSATAGALAWERNLRLCYLEGDWDPQQGAAGLNRCSKMTIIRNPSRSRGYQRRNEALNSYERGNFVAAAEGFEASQTLIEDSFFDLLAVQLCQCYCVLADFDRRRLHNAVQNLENVLQIGGIRKLHENRLNVKPHLEHLKKFAEGDLVVMTAVLMELADIYSQQGRYDFAGLLLYRAMEAIVQHGLAQRIPQFDISDPKWDCFGIAHDQLAKEYAALSRDGKAVLPQREVTLQSGFGLLCLIDNDVALRFMETETSDPDKIKVIKQNAVGKMMGLGRIRNQSYLAHAFQTLSNEDSMALRNGANELAEAVLGCNFAEFVVLRGMVRPINLRQIMPSG